jgi:hypothetical protein
VIFLTAVLIAIPRFNWGELPGIFKSMSGGKPFDTYQYITYIEYFRGDNTSEDKLASPFSYRPLPSLLASFLPFEAETSLNLINLFSLLAGVMFIYLILKLLGINFKYRSIGMLLYILSFPYFYYGTSGYIDSVFILALLILLYLMLKRRWKLLIITIILAVMVKETVVIFLPVLFVFLYNDALSGTRLRRLSIFAAAASAIIIVSLIIRNIVPGQATYLWNPKFELLTFNLLRIKTYLSFGLSLGIPGILSFFALKTILAQKRTDQLFLTLLTGVVISLLLSFYSLFSAYADGRHIWTAYPYLIPLSVMFLDKSKSKFFISSEKTD